MLAASAMTRCELRPGTIAHCVGSVCRLACRCGFRRGYGRGGGGSDAAGPALRVSGLARLVEVVDRNPTGVRTVRLAVV